MAYITYRQSDNSQTEAQLTKQDKVKGQPLTMYEVDANFKSVNDHLKELKNVYGVGTANKDGSTIQDIYGFDDANRIDSTGFYSTLATTSNMPSTVVDGSAVLHLENVNQTSSNKLAAFEITSDADNLWHRIRRGTSSWDQWEKIVTEKDVAAHTANLQANTDKKVSKVGDVMTGSLTISNNGVLNIINPVAQKNYGISSAYHTTSISFLDKRGLTDVTKYSSYRLGSVSNDFEVSSTTICNETSLRASNPADPDHEYNAKMSVGWTKALVDGVEQIVEYAEAPAPRMTIESRPKQIATVRWTVDQINSIVNDKFDPSLYVKVAGDTINGPIDMENTLDVKGDITCESSIDCSSLYAGEGIDSSGSMHISYDSGDEDKPYTYSTKPSTTLKSGVAFGVDDPSLYEGLPEGAEPEDPNFMDIAQHGGLMNVVDTQGNNTVSLVVKRWGDALTEGAQQYKLGLTINADGTVTTHAPTPKDASDSNEIVTTEWIRRNITSSVDFGEM